LAYRSWFERFQARFAKERAEMAARGFALDESALQNSGRVEFVGKSRVDPNLRAVA
jgi:hypothetical protein